MLPLLRSNLPPALDDLDKAECLASSLESQCSPSTEPIDPGHLCEVNLEVERRAAATPSPSDEPLSPTTLDEVKSILQDLNTKKAPGPDRITNKTLRRRTSQVATKVT
ncbi:unnamed protein product [Euphydryas editha]|uniref:Reverse transcriptase n=1 Tax=Euphydryas editha TaxID=104508 RepID=A0AAU9TZ40_EUPED|nr:unnamed protein product [Euphydryas editha]